MSDKTDDDEVQAEAPKFEFFEPHPFLTIFPVAGTDDLAWIEQDVAQVGVREELVLWKDNKSRVWLIDGRNRQTAANVVFQRKVDAAEEPVAANGVSLQPNTRFFDGTFDEMTEYVKGTHVRRNYSASQKAAVGVRLYYFNYRAKHKGRLPTPQQEVQFEAGTGADDLAKASGVNPYYIRICRRLYREADDLLDAVASGVTSAQRAQAAFKKRKSGVPDDQADEDDETDKGGDAGQVVKDSDGADVPENLVDAFRSRGAYRAVSKSITKIQADVAKLAAQPGGDWLDVEVLDKRLAAVKKELRKAKPHVICARCAGKGKVNRWECTTCDGKGYLSAGIDQAAKKQAAAGTAGGSDDVKAKDKTDDTEKDATE